MHSTVSQNQAHSVNLSTGSSVSIKALRVLQGLLSTIASFWTADDVNLVVDLYLLHDVATETLVMANLVKAVAKRVPSSVLIPTLCDTWKRLKESSATTSFGAFFLLVKKAIHAAPRAELLHRLRALFSLFLDGFVVQSNEETSDAEVRSTVPLLPLGNSQASRRPRPNTRQSPHSWSWWSSSTKQLSDPSSENCTTGHSRKNQVRECRPF